MKEVPVEVVVTQEVVKEVPVEVVVEKEVIKEIDNINDQIENFNNMILSQYNE